MPEIILGSNMLAKIKCGDGDILKQTVVSNGNQEDPCELPTDASKDAPFSSNF
jgi:hypothetical protein